MSGAVNQNDHMNCSDFHSVATGFEIENADVADGDDHYSSFHCCGENAGGGKNGGLRGKLHKWVLVARSDES